MRHVLPALALAVGIASCRQSTEPPVPVVVSLVANTTVVSQGDTVTFTVNATGNNLFGVVVDYGDSVTEQYAAGGANSARVSFKHAYAAPGTFTVRAIVTDAIAGEKEASVSIVVN